MKKRTTIFFCLLATMFMGAKNSSAQAYEEGQSAVSLGYGFGTFIGALANTFENQSGYEYSSFGPMYLKYEYGVAENIGIGLNLAYVQYTFEFNYDDYDINGNPATYREEDKFSSFSGLLRINWHFGDNDKLDPYYGLGVGYRTGSWSVTSNDPDGTYSATYETIIPFGFETTFGVRFLFSDNFGAYLEAGAAKSVVQLGLCGKF